MVRGTGFTGGDVVYVEECLRPNGGCDLDKITSVTILANGVPVSYTHLDVYKRQASFRVGEPPGDALPCRRILAGHLPDNRGH